jgi:hypothetical protein
MTDQLQRGLRLLSARQAGSAAPSLRVSRRTGSLSSRTIPAMPF